MAPDSNSRATDGPPKRAVFVGLSKSDDVSENPEATSCPLRLDMRTAGFTAMDLALPDLGCVNTDL